MNGDHIYRRTARRKDEAFVLKNSNAGAALGSRLLTHIAAAAVIVLLCLACMLQTADAASDFIIKDYDIDMVVNEDDTYLITETIDVHFTAPSHGIYRTIPYKTRLDRDGQVSVFYGKVKDFEMLSGQKVEKEKGDECCYYRIGSSSKYADEDTTYKFSYVFDMRGDHLTDADEVFYNLVGTYWEAQDIEHVSFKVTFPKDIDMNNVGMKTGFQVDVPFKTEGKRVVYGETDEDVREGLTIRAVLPEGYFTKQAMASNLLIYILIVLMAGVTCWGAVLWRKYGRDPRIVETEEFYPPDGLSAPEVGYLDDGEIKGEHITSLLLTLADKGYLKIIEKDSNYNKKTKEPKPSYEIEKVRDYDGDSEDERIFMDGLFKNGRSTVRMSQLKNHFYETVEEIEEAIKYRYEGWMYDEKAESGTTKLRIAGTLCMIALAVVSKITNGSPFIVGNGDFWVYIIFMLLEIGLPIYGFYRITKWFSGPRFRTGKFLWGTIVSAFAVAVGFGLAVLFDTCIGVQIPAYLMGLGMIFLLFLMASLCRRKSDEYSALLGRIRGYKHFLQVAEKDKMETLAEDDPGYFYKNLAFAFALGVTSVYAKRFADMAKQPPEWYDSYRYRGYGYGYWSTHSFDSMGMMDSMDSMMTHVSSSMTSSPSSSGSGSSGGGSFSGGGGAGGGGGGSW